MKKKIFLSGTVYDLSCTAPHEIESDLNKRLFKQIGKALTTHVSIDDANKTFTVRIDRSFSHDFQFKDDSILQQDEWLITGECESFQPAYRPLNPLLPLGAVVYDYKDDFIYNYKKNSAYYGAAKRIKSVEVEETMTYLKFTLRF